MEYAFTLRYQLADAEQDMADLVERLGAAGCDDALVGTGLKGRLALEFAREADSAEQALFSALADVRQAVPDARLIEVTPDLVGLTDAAEIVGVSRQNMRKLMLTHAASFPAPVHEGSTSIWHLADILLWLQGRRQQGSAEPALIVNTLEVAKVAMQINISKEQHRLSAGLTP